MAAYALPGIFVMGCLVYFMEPYVIRCPEQSEWNIRAEIRCQNITKYFCLYNYIRYTYEEGCTGPDWDIPGSKRVYSRNFNKAPCNDTRYQPIIFVTNGSSDCIFRKSLCTEEGQTLFEAGTTKTDRTCRCDFKRGYAFVTVPRNKCSCRPSEEDCSCYVKKCQGIGYNLSADYECTKDVTKKTVCPLMSENSSEDSHIDMAPTGTLKEDDSYAIKRTYDVAILVSICLFVMIVSTGIAMYIVLQQRLPRSRRLSTEETCTAETERMDTGRSLNAIGQKVTNDESAVEVHIESERMDTGPSLDTIEQNATNDQSDNEDQIAVRERDENRKSAAEQLIDSIEKEGLDAAFKHFKEDLENWRNEPVKLAVTGKSGVGKSSFINAIRNLKPGDPGFTTTSSYGNTTKHATVFKYPENPNITLHDLPGFATTEFPINEYKEKLELHKYDFFLIFVRNIEENDIEIAKILKEMDKPFCFVRSKLDLDIENAQNDGESKAEAIEKIMSKSLDILSQKELKEAKLFIISNRSRTICHFNELVSYIQRIISRLKCYEVMPSQLGELSDDIIDSKYQNLKVNIKEVSLRSAILVTIPNPDLNIWLDVKIICKEIWLYYNTFGFGQQIVKEFSKYDYLRKKLSASSIIGIEASNVAMEKFVAIQLGKFGKLTAVQIPIIGSVVTGIAAVKIARNLLTSILNGCRDDAKLVYFHLMIVNARK